MNKYLLTSVILLGFGLSIQAQINPPDFQCIKGDTLFWQAPVNTCGPFVNYEIWFSTSKNGPYTKITTILVETRTSSFHPNPTKELRYYYLVANYVCPGQPVKTSDTLDNRPPVVSPIHSVSITANNQVNLNWKASPSPQVHAYVIYRETPIGVVPVDTVFGKTTYTDLKAEPHKKPESYFVNAIDKCGNTSIFDSKHTSMFLEATVSACEQTVDLKWNTYNGWTQGINKQEVWAGINGSVPIKRDSLPPSQTSYRFKNVTDGSTYCFYIKADGKAAGEMATSNQVCLTVKVVRPVKDLYLRNVTVNAFGEVELSWSWNVNSEIKKAEVWRSTQKQGGFQVIQNISIPPTLPQTITFTDKSSGIDKGPVYYQIRTVDVCDTIVSTGTGYPNYLTGVVQPNGDNLLSWASFGVPYETVKGHEVYRILKSGESKITPVPIQLTTFADPFDPTVTGQTEACYYVVTLADVKPPGLPSISVTSRSNVFCMEQTLGIYIPNAFSPNGVNNLFQAHIVPAEFSYFEMKILDRYGNEMYLTTDPTAGWDGLKNGKEVPTGVYMYQIKVTRPNGKSLLRAGTLTLLR